MGYMRGKVYGTGQVCDKSFQRLPGDTLGEIPMTLDWFKQHASITIA